MLRPRRKTSKERGCAAIADSALDNITLDALSFDAVRQNVKIVDTFRAHQRVTNN